MFLVLAAIAAIFLPALSNGFVNWDDPRNFLENYKYRGLGPEQLRWMFTTFHLGPYQPLSWVTLGLDYLIWGMDPFGYHLGNVLLHSVNSALFYLLCRRLLAAAIYPLSAGKEVVVSAGVSAFFFAAHPLRVESVAWITERRDVLSGLFYLLTLLWYVRARDVKVEITAFWRRHVLPSAAFLLSLLAKGMSVTLPLVLVLLDIYPLKRLPMNPGRWFSREYRVIWLEKIPFAVLAAVFGLLGYIGQAVDGAVIPLRQYDFSAHAAEALFGAGFYIWKTVIPVRLSPLYRVPGEVGLANHFVLLSGAGLIAVTIIAALWRRRFPGGITIWVYYLSTLSPILLLIRTLADRYTYIPGMGFALLAGALVLKCQNAANRKLRAAGLSLALLAMAVLAALTLKQETIWRDSGTLWRHALAMDPGLPLAHYNLGQWLREQGKPEEAARHYAAAVKLKPDYAEAHLNLGIVLAAQGRMDEAATEYREAIRYKPGSVEAINNLGTILTLQGKYSEAAKQYIEVLRIAPDSAETHNNLGVVLFSQGRVDEAIGQYVEALKIRPDYRNAALNLNDALAAQGRLQKH